MLTDLLTFLVDLGKKLQSILYWFTDKIHDVAVGVWNWIVNALCYTVEVMISGIDFNADIFSSGLGFVGLPPQVIYILGRIHIQECIMILVTAITVRVMLNLIPGVFTRV